MIEIKTLDELRAGRTVIQITVGSEPVADVSPAEGELTRLRNELARVTGELVEAQRLLAVARMAEDSRLKDRDNRIGELEADLATARASEVAAERLTERNSKIESLETKLGLAHADRANLKREVTRLEGELDAASRLAQSADTRRATAELRAEQAAADLDAATGHLLLRDGELASANDQRDAVSAQYVRERDLATENKARADRAEAQRDAEHSRAEQNKAWAERAEGHLATARASLMQTRHELAIVNDNFVASQNRVRELEEANASLVAEASQRQADPGTRLYTAAEVADAQTSEAELVTAPLKGRIIELEAELDNQYGEVGRAYEKLTSLSTTFSGMDVMRAMGEVAPGTPGDVLARSIRIARMTLGISKPRN